MQNDRQINCKKNIKLYVINILGNCTQSPAIVQKSSEMAIFLYIENHALDMHGSEKLVFPSILLVIVLLKFFSQGYLLNKLARYRFQQMK